MRATKTAPDRAEALAAVLDGIGATVVVRRLVALAEDGGLRPHADPEPDGHGRIAVVLDGPGCDSLFGVIYLSPRRGTVIRAFLMNGNDGVERRLESVAGIRAALKPAAGACLATRQP
jgi:hypothetical protein